MHIVFSLLKLNRYMFRYTIDLDLSILTDKLQQNKNKI